MTNGRLQRRLTAILATDVVGYSRLMGVDEAGTLARLKRIRVECVDPAIAANSGRTVKLIGDGSLVEFASVVDAVDAALLIQDRIAASEQDVAAETTIRLRMGVHVGDIIIDDDDIYGDGVNIAARIEALADPGGVFLSRSAADAVRGKLPVTLQSRGRRQVKNIAQPIEVFRVDWDARKSANADANEASIFAPSWPPEGERDRAPYRGLSALEAADAGVFFGRDSAISEASERLRTMAAKPDQRILVVLAASGAGKSSFLRAGLLPHLARELSEFRPFPVLRPGRGALYGENGLLAALESVAPKLTRAELRAAIREGTGRLRPLLAELAGVPSGATGAGDNSTRRATLVFAIDQAEELFRSDSGEEGPELLKLVRAFAETREPTILTIFAIRSDAYDALQRANALEGLPQDPLSLPPLPRASYREVIEGPARRFVEAGGKLAIEPQLTERLLADLERSGGDALPLLAFTLEQLFLEYRRAGALRLRDYEEFGALSGAIAAAVDRAFARADADPRIPRERKARESLLRRGLIPWLAGIDPETRSPRRNIARRSDIPEEARPLVDLLVEERLLSSDVRSIADPQTGGQIRLATIEPAHEALLRQWGLLEGWINEDFGLLSTLEGVKRAARDWRANDEAEGWLAHQGGRLAEARALDARPDLSAQLGAADRVYLERCGAREAAAQAERERAQAAETARAEAETKRALAEARHARQRARLIGAIGAVCAVAAAAGGGLAYVAHEQALRAENSYRIARDAADSLVVDIAQGLRNVEGMPTASVRRILETSRQAIERLAAAAPEDWELAASRAFMKRQFAINYAAIGDLEGAQKFADASVEASRAIRASHPSGKATAALAGSLLAAARVQYQRGDATAQASVDEATSLARTIADPSGDNVDAVELLVRAGVLIADIDVRAGKVAAALAAARQTVELVGPLAEAKPGDAPLALLLVDALERYGNILGGIPTAMTVPSRLDPALRPPDDGLDRPAALAAFQKVADILETQSTRDPVNTDLRARLENILIRIGDLELALSHMPEALAAHRRALQISSELLAADAGNTEWKRRVEVNHFKLYAVARAGRQPDEEVSRSLAALDIGERLFNLNPHNLLWRHDYENGLRNAFVALQAKGEPEKAQPYIDRSLVVTRETIKLYPEDVGARIALALSLYVDARARPAEEAAPRLKEALGELEALDREGRLPHANSNWAPFIRNRLAEILGEAAPR